MNEIPLTVVGTVVRDVTFTTTKAGTELANFRIASNNRRWNRVSGTWEDGDTSFLNVTCWRTLAQNVEASIRKGDPVVVTGRLRVREWSNEERSGISVDLEATSVGHDLSKGRGSFQRTKRGAQDSEGAAATALQQAAARAGVDPDLIDPELLEQGGSAVELEEGAA